MHSKGREDKQVHMYKEIIPALRVSRLRKHRSKATLWKLRDSGYKADLDLVAFVASQKGFLFLPTLFSTFNMQLPTAHCFFAVYLTLFGYLGEVYAGTVPMNSNAIKNLPADIASKGVDAVSPSPRTSPPGGTGHKSVDALQVIPCVKVNSVRHGTSLFAFHLNCHNCPITPPSFYQIIVVRRVHGRW